MSLTVIASLPCPNISIAPIMTSVIGTMSSVPPSGRYRSCRTVVAIITFSQDVLTSKMFINNKKNKGEEEVTRIFGKLTQRPIPVMYRYASLITLIITTLIIVLTFSSYILPLMTRTRIGMTQVWGWYL